MGAVTVIKDVNDLLLARGREGALAAIEEAVQQAVKIAPPAPLTESEGNSGGSNDEGNSREEYSSAPGYEPFTDRGNAERLINRHGDALRYCDTRGGWLAYDGTRWQRDESGQIIRWAVDTMRELKSNVELSFASQIEAAEDDDERKELEKQRDRIIKHCRDSESHARLKAMVEQARSVRGVFVAASQLDTDDMLLNCTNGTLDLRTGQLREHRRGDMITRLVPVAYDPEAQCPKWLAFLDYTFAGNQSIIRYIQRSVGYTLTGKTGERVMWLLHGEGDNGKSTFADAVRYVMGDYAVNTASETLLKRDKREQTNDLAMLAGARLVTASETEEGRRLNTALVKQITGGTDPVTARFLHQEFFSFQPTFKLWMHTNHKPRVTQTETAIWRRIRLIPFTVTVPEDKKNPELPDQLKAEAAGILAWAVEGCREWQQTGLATPPEVIEATRRYQQDEDMLAQFLADCTEDGEQCLQKKLKEAYQRWCDDNHCSPLTAPELSKQLASKGYMPDKGSGNKAIFRGLHLVQSDYEPGGEG